MDSFQFHLGADLILRAHIKPVYETKSSGKEKKKKQKKNVENGGKAAEQAGKCVGGRRAELWAWRRSTLTDYGLTFGVRAGEMSDGL